MLRLLILFLLVAFNTHAMDGKKGYQIRTINLKERREPYKPPSTPVASSFSSSQVDEEQSTALRTQINNLFSEEGLRAYFSNEALTLLRIGYSYDQVVTIIRLMGIFPVGPGHFSPEILWCYFIKRLFMTEITEEERNQIMSSLMGHDGDLFRSAVQYLNRQ